MTARRLIALLVAAALLALPGAASAATRNVSPNGSGIECSDVQPCTLAYAVLSAQDDDEVVLSPGTYDVSAAPALSPTHRIHVHGQSGAARPVIASSTPAQPIFWITQPGAAGTKLEHVDVHVGASDGSGISATQPVTIADTQVESKGVCAHFTGGVNVTDSKFVQSAGALQGCFSAYHAPGNVVSRVAVDSDSPWSAATIGGPDARIAELSVHSKGAGLFVFGEASGHVPVVRRSTIAATNHAVDTRFDAVITDTVVSSSNADGIDAREGALELRNVTSVAAKIAISALPQFSVGDVDSGRIVARSVIARGQMLDVVGYPHNPSFPCTPNPVCKDGSVAIDHSVYDSHNSSVTAGEGNRGGDARFVDAAAGDFHLLADSPAIDTGADDALNGVEDRDGNTRLQGAAPDAGAYETAPAPAGGSGDPSGGTGTGGDGGQQTIPAADITAPTISALKLTRRVFAVARTRTPVTAGARRGTKLRYSLSEAAGVRVRVQRLRRGVKPRTVATLRRSGRAGANAIAFSGRIGRRALRTGKYRATLVATDAAGNRSKPVTVAFRVVRG